MRSPCFRQFAPCRANGCQNASSSRRAILVVEDEPLIALQITQAFEDAGAKVVVGRTLKTALIDAEDGNLSAAIIDHALGDGDSTQIVSRLKERDVRFMIYSGFEKIEGACVGAPHLSKPASGAQLVAAMEDLLRDRVIAT
jgi:DNA-binding response OmpR family regulator